MSRGNTLLLGIAVGALGIVLYTRLRQIVEEEDPEILVDRLSQQLEALEARTRRQGASSAEA